MPRDRDVTIIGPGRIVSIGGAITEILYALGLEDRLVGVDTTSLYPAARCATSRMSATCASCRPKACSGSIRRWCSRSKGAGPKETMAVLEAAKVPLVLVPETFSGQGIVDKISWSATPWARTSAAECLTAVVDRRSGATARAARQGDASRCA